VAVTSSSAGYQFALKRILRPLVPKRVLEERNICHRLGSEAARPYAQLRLLDTLGIRHLNKRTVPPGARSFVFVCFGNIMRSPTAELMFKRELLNHGRQGIDVNSAGIHTSPGREAHERAQIAARKLGFDLSHHRSKPLTAEMVAQADAILAMDFQNKAELLAQFPEARERIYMLSAYAENGRRYREIADPYFGDQDQADRCFTLLLTCVHNLAESVGLLASQNGAPRAGGVRG
jgi:protein-tyrosine phosphatase